MKNNYKEILKKVATDALGQELLVLLIGECISSETNLNSDGRQKNLERLRGLAEAIPLLPEYKEILGQYEERIAQSIEVLERETIALALLSNR